MHDFTVPKRLYLPPSKLLSQAGWWAVLTLPPLTFPPRLFLQLKTAASLIPQITHFTRNKCILLFTDFLFCAFCGFFLSSLFANAYVCAHSHAAFTASKNPDCVLSLTMFHIVILCSRCNIRLFRNPTINHLSYCWQTSKRFWLAAHFLSISNTQVDRNTKEEKLQSDV